MPPPPPRSTLFPYTTLFRSGQRRVLLEAEVAVREDADEPAAVVRNRDAGDVVALHQRERVRSEEHTSELQSHHDLVCRLLLEKKKMIKREGRQQAADRRLSV